MKILLVDDERTEREGIRFLIEKFQFELEVAEAANGKLAMEYLQKYQDVGIFKLPERVVSEKAYLPID